MFLKYAKPILLALVWGGCSAAPSSPRVATETQTVAAPAAALDLTREPGPGPGRADRTELMEITAGSHSDYELVSLCRLVRTPDWDGMGLYTVTGLINYTEERSSRAGARGAYTYVELELLDPWYKAQKRVVARIPGGRSPSGEGTIMWFIGLKVGEQVGLLLGDARADNRGYYDIRELGLFRERQDGGYTNGQLFTQRHVDADELGRLVKGLAGGGVKDPCPYDEAPDIGTGGPELVPEPIQHGRDGGV
jgi:hypothetical protein